MTDEWKHTAIALSGFFAAIASSLIFAWVVFKPITHRPTNDAGPRFQLADLFSLIVLWQYGLLFVTALHRRDRGAPEGMRGSTPHLMLGAVLILVLTALWYGLATSLSERGVRSGWRRGAVIGLGTPLGIVGTIAMFPLTIFAVVDYLKRGLAIAEIESLRLIGACLLAGAVARLILAWAMRQPTGPRLDERPDDATPDA